MIKVPDAKGNEYLLDGDRVVIKCARPRNDQVGVTYQTLDRVSAVIGAFQRDDGSFDLWSLTRRQYRGCAEETTVGLNCRVGKGMSRRPTFKRQADRSDA